MQDFDCLQCLPLYRCVLVNEIFERIEGICHIRCISRFFWLIGHFMELLDFTSSYRSCGACHFLNWLGNHQINQSPITKTKKHVMTKVSFQLEVIIVPIVSKTANASVTEAVDKLGAHLSAAGIRVKIDSSASKSPGWKFNFWEMKAGTTRSTIRSSK